MTNKSQLQTALTFALKTIKELESIIEQDKDIKTLEQLEREEAIEELMEVLLNSNGITLKMQLPRMMQVIANKMGG